MKKQKFKAERSTEGTVFELAFLSLAIVVWVAILLFYNQAPDIIPTHFGPSGAPDAYGSKAHIFFPCILITVVAAFMMAGSYFPHSVNLPGIYLVNERQAAFKHQAYAYLGHHVAAVSRSCCLGYAAWASLVCADNDCRRGAGLCSIHISYL